MTENQSRKIASEIAEIEHIIGNFKEMFSAGTSTADNFMTMTELEMMWGELQHRTNNIYSDMIRKLMSEVDESDLIRKKKLLQTVGDKS